MKQRIEQIRTRETNGEPVEVIGLDDRRSSLRKGIVFRVCKGGREYSVGKDRVSGPLTTDESSVLPVVLPHG